ncbi:MAG: phosphate/phosphite/phosphonate ABC transporter substrate-binding protein [SAR202 cluster bacterium]|nr:phosphate/phosphite/phosphonate ABC transporter substrate-binding protein [SAR202 cluster bacterium]
MKPVRIGTVLYNPKVTVIWDIIKEYFEEQGIPTDIVYYPDYDRQTDGFVKGEIDVAWNSPLAWVDALRRTNGRCRAIAMRDSDVDRVSYIIARKDSGIRSLADLQGKTFATGAPDSPQSTLIPLEFLRENGIEPDRDIRIIRAPARSGWQGDDLDGEFAAFKKVVDGEADASAILDWMWEFWVADGKIDASQVKIIARTETFDHCVFAAREDFDIEVEKKWVDALLSMSYDNPRHKQMMDMEGLKEWLPGRSTGFGPLTRATENQRFFAKQPA